MSTSVALPVCEDSLHDVKIIESASIFKDGSLWRWKMGVHTSFCGFTNLVSEF